MSGMQGSALCCAEARNQPEVFPGLVTDWPARKLWQGHAGLEHLSNLAGSAPVQAMINDKDDSLFFGDMRQFQPSTCSFAAFLASTQQTIPIEVSRSHHQQHKQHQAYLAQASLDSGQPLHALQQDVQVPEVLQYADLSHTNLWMTSRKSRCSLHYDPYHNLLCVVQGQKAVRLMSPEATAFLYPHSVVGESPNHSQVNFATPDLQKHPLYKEALLLQQEFVLQALPAKLVKKQTLPGDALFIPEGWWHQVDSQDMTIAVNFWWRSAFTKSLQPHMHAYYLRRVMDSLLDAERHKALQSITPHPQLQDLYQDLLGAGSDQEPNQCDATRRDGSATSDASFASQSSSPTASSSSESAMESEVPTSHEAQSNVPASKESLNHAQKEAPQFHERPMNAMLSPEERQQKHLASSSSQKQTGKRSVQSKLDTAATEATASWTPRKRRACEADAKADSSEMAKLEPVLGNESGPGNRAECKTIDSTMCNGSRQGQSDGHYKLAASRSSDGAGKSRTSHHPETADKQCQCMPPSISPGGGEDQQVEWHPSKRVCRMGPPRQYQLASSQLHMVAMSLLSGAVNDSISQEQAGVRDIGLDGPVAQILHTLQPADVQSVLLLMAKHVPRTLEGLLLFALSPAAAEVMTQKLEAASADAGSEEQKQFYDALYGVSADPQTVLHRLLDLKEAFSWEVCKHALSHVLGMECNLKSLVTG